MATLTQGDVLPSTISGQQTQTTVPDFYSNYLQDITNLGRNAVTQGGVAGLSPLQQQALNMAPETAFAGAGTAGTAQDLLTQAGYTGAPEIAQSYMNPYTTYMNDEMGRLVSRNINETVIPQLQAGAIGSGNYGSQRMANVTGQTLRDIAADLYGKQMGNLQTGYQSAMTNAQADLNRGAQAGVGLGNLAAQQQGIGTGALTTLNNLGNIEKTQAQTELDYPMAQTEKFSKLLSGQAIPTGSLQQTISPGQAGNFQQSPLAQVMTLMNALMAVTNPNTTQLPIPSSSATTTTPGTTTTPAITSPSTITPGSSTATIGKADGGYIDGGEISSLTTQHPEDDEMGTGQYMFGPNGQLYDPRGNLVE